MKILKKLSFIIGMPFTGILLMILILSMALATFVESGSGVNAAWALIYDTWWFELIFVIVLINLVGNIFRLKLLRRSKITVFVFHLAFVFIILGAGITRFFSVEGLMHIREGNVSGSMISDATYMEIEVTEGESVVSDSEKVRLSVLTPKKFRWTGKINGKKVKIKSVDYLRSAVPQYVGAPGGDPYVQLILMAGRQINVGLSKGEVARYQELSVSFEATEAVVDLNVFLVNDTLRSFAVDTVYASAMGDPEQKMYLAGESFPLERGKLYSMGNNRFALQRYLPSAKMQYVETGMSGHTSGIDVTRLMIRLDGMESTLYVPGGANMEGEASQVEMGNVRVKCRYGSQRIRLPFVLRLEDFRVDRYPGSNSPSSFESDVVLIDEELNITEEHNIYMNNVLKHRGYRFYQSSYDQDEKGSILSVNRDLAGTSVTYLGYFLMALGMILALFDRGTRFTSIAKSSSAKSSRVVTIAIILALSGSIANAQNYPVPSKESASEFGKLWVQGKEGRFKPMNALSSEVMRKVVKESEFKGYNADQVVLGMISYPDAWKNAPLFEVDHPELHQMLGFKGSAVSFNDFISDGRYLLSPLVNDAYKKRVQERNDLDKEVMKLDEKINVFYMIQTGAMLRIFPDPESEEGKWHAVSDLLENETASQDTLGKVFLIYTRALRENNTDMASDIIAFIEQYQKDNSRHELLDGRKKAEIFYNKVNLFNRMIKFYGLFGLVLLFLQFMKIFRSRKWVDYAFTIGIIHIAVAFGIHTVFLGIRWYVSGHAPLSNGYESMIFVSWISLLAGLIFVRRTGFAIALTAILSTLALLVAHMSWMNPDITNLVPVLKSPWLTIHVTVIMAGYGFLGMSMLMGLVNLVFYSISGRDNRNKIVDVVGQITKVNHLSVIIGLYFLTIGTFLGGVWANESWGRYWGWDPKETWALISVLVYTFITHMHRFPGMKGIYAFNLATLLGYFSILMTYFGVNYFLGGIHSYAGGAAFKIPVWVYLLVILLFVLAMIAYRKQKSIKENNYLPES